MVRELSVQKKFSREIVKKKPDLAVVEQLLRDGANVNEDIPKVCIREETIASALHVAAISNNVELAELLLRYNAEVSLESLDGCTAIEAAAYFDAADVTEILINHDAVYDADLLQRAVCHRSL